MTTAYDTSTEALTYQQRVAVSRLHALLELLPSALDKHLHEAGLTAFEFTLLEALAEAPSRKMRLSALASKTNATLPRLSRVVTGMERKGLVERTPCPEDGRAFNAQLTGAGERSLEDALPLHAHAVREMVLDDLSPEEVDQFAGLVLKILGRLDPDRKLDVTACLADPALPTGVACAADPAPPQDACPADPAE